LDKVRALYAADASGGMDSLGLTARIEADRLMITYPMTLVVWTLSPTDGAPRGW
jgi:hypothetical protein